ncbi:MAG TPA: PH domain-containing protein [Dermatophilaceae bacterium]|nr:PH domain-containing protein [Dermatophilaceae bacterium]
MRARQRPELDERFRRSKLHRYLLADEEVIVAQRQHWAVMWKPILIGVAGLIVVIAANVLMDPGTLTDLLWWVLFGLAIWGAGRWYVWRRNWLVATNKRVMVNYGVLNQGVAMFSLSRVPDLTYTRSTLGQLLGYGEMQRESSGSSQTLHKLKFVEQPHATYTTICAAIFDLQDRMFGMDEEENEHRFEDGPPPHTPGLYSGHLPSEDRPVTQERPVPTDFPREPDQDDDSVGIQIRYGASAPSRYGEHETWYESSDLRDSSLRDADTGPIPYRPPSTDESYGWSPPTTGRDQGGSGRDKKGKEEKDRDRDDGRDPSHGHDHDHDR